MHLIIDGYAKDPEKTTDTEFIHHFLDTYPKQIGMTKVSVPTVSRYKTPNPDEEGVSGFVLLAESHISVHTFPDQSYINIDIFSCNDFDPAQAVKGMEEKFGLERVKSYILNRPHPDID